MHRRFLPLLSGSDMSPQKYDVLFAFKAIALSDQLNGTEKQIAAAIIDHYNHKTGRCDPSLETLAVIIGKSRRTVIRGAGRVVKLKFLRKIRHGGNNHCNSYQPQWEFYRSLEKSWKQRRQHHTDRFARQRMSPSPCQPCHNSRDKDGTQTSSTNNIPLTYEPSDSIQQLNKLEPKRLAKGGLALHASGVSMRSTLLGPPRSKEVARNSAERRWNKDLLDRFQHDAKLYGMISEAVDADLQSGATEAELRRVGAGFKHVLEELLKRGVLPNSVA